ncbi:uncharacterized protein HaLaN_09632 [Haematococcus lacustris]|uniref:uracil phosphoribosyltransferase n=1 Tax=Haematococcus lacustris TaxID=44745 RepID=A0A699YTZ7_HAELA|nr:uncharacterized protein HaLaN_09632 [Haematococcus lacustris]
MFRAAAAELGRILIYEAVRDMLPVVEAVIETPLGQSEAAFVDVTKPIKVIPVLRAGLVLLEQAQSVLPSHETFHVGYVRDDETLVARPYLNKLPVQFAEDDKLLITDPMLATGGTMLQVVDDCIARGAKPENIRIVSIVAAPPAMVKLSEKYKGIKVYTGCIDAELNEKGYIVPGLGDAGDRAYGTTK